MGLYDIRTWAQHQMKGVAQQNTRASLHDVPRQHGFHRAIGSAGHKGRCLNDAPTKGQLAASGKMVYSKQFKLHFSIALKGTGKAYSLLLVPCCFPANQHGITVAEEPVLLSDGSQVRSAGIIHTGEGTDQHQQG